jgi:GNAT superfamily N-acetyltransferase
MDRVRERGMAFLLPHRYASLVVRRARPADAAAIARVQVQSWHETYTGIIPQPYLDQLSVLTEERKWRRTLSSGGWAFIAEWDQTMVGFGSGGLSRVRRDITGEIYVLYVLSEYQGRGIGRALFDVCHYELGRCGHHGLLIWVLADNPACGFYEHLGGVIAGENRAHIAGARLRELAYIWPD